MTNSSPVPRPADPAPKARPTRPVPVDPGGAGAFALTAYWSSLAFVVVLAAGICLSTSGAGAAIAVVLLGLPALQLAASLLALGVIAGAAPPPAGRAYEVLGRVTVRGLIGAAFGAALMSLGLFAFLRLA